MGSSIDKQKQMSEAKQALELFKLKEKEENILDKYCNKDYLISNTSIPTRIGLMYLVKVKEYELFMREYLQLVFLRNEDLAKMMQLGNHPHQNIIEQILTEQHLFDILSNEDMRMALNLNEIKTSYDRLFEFVFKVGGMFDKIAHKDEFDELLHLIKVVNLLSIRRPSGNEEWDRWMAKETEIKERVNGKVDFESIYTTVWGFIKEEPSELTLYQLRALFHRYTKIKESDYTHLFKTVSNEVKTVSFALASELTETLNEKQSGVTVKTTGDGNISIKDIEDKLK